MTLNIVIIHILIVSCSTGKILLCARVVLYFIQFFFKVILIQVCVHNCILFANCHASVCSCEGANIEICTESIPLYVCCMRNTCLVFFHEHNQKLKIEIWKKKMLMKKVENYIQQQQQSMAEPYSMCGWSGWSKAK